MSRPKFDRPIDADTRNSFDGFLLVLAAGALVYLAGYFAVCS